MSKKKQNLKITIKSNCLLSFTYFAWGQADNIEEKIEIEPRIWLVILKNWSAKELMVGLSRQLSQWDGYLASSWEGIWQSGDRICIYLNWATKNIMRYQESGFSLTENTFINMNRKYLIWLGDIVMNRSP